VNTKGFNSFLDYYSTVNRYTGYISVAGLGFAPNKPGPNLVIFISSVDGMSVAF
jgi:hypothetical protein